jgi:hypothetical protein
VCVAEENAQSYIFCPYLDCLDWLSNVPYAGVMTLRNLPFLAASMEALRMLLNGFINDITKGC